MTYFLLIVVIVGCVALGTFRWKNRALSKAGFEKLLAEFGDGAWLIAEAREFRRSSFDLFAGVLGLYGWLYALVYLVARVVT